LDMELATIETPGLKIGGRGPDFSLLGTDGKQYSLSSFEDMLLALIFISNGCPTVRACEERMIIIQKDYISKGVRLLAVNSNNEHLSSIDRFEEMVTRAKEDGFNFPYVKDTDGKVARSYGAICTPHVFVLDRDRKLRYRGRIDNSRDASRVTSRDLMNALDDLIAVGDARLSGVRVSETEPFGCSIVW